MKVIDRIFLISKYLYFMAVGRNAKDRGDTMGMVAYYWHSNKLMHSKLLDSCGIIN